MSNRQFLLCVTPGLFVAAVLAAVTTAGEPPQPAEALADFQKAWKPMPVREHMRPLDETGWKARLEALKKLAGAGEKAGPTLTDALQKGDDDTRVFAAQALALLPDAAAKAPLAEALKDKHPAVRLYALDALSMFGKLPDEEPYQTLQQKDANRDVRSHAGFAIGRDDKPKPEAIRQALQDYDLKTMATAKLGEKAPDFILTSAAGKEVRLSDFRGKKPVVLVFVYGDT
jgi:HEAT repeat protein